MKRLSILLPAIYCSFALHAELPDWSLREYPPMSIIYHPVSTRNPEAQRHFDIGLTNIFAFNHDLAYREFKIASGIDPNLAMAYWGMALSLGQNINDDITPENEKICYDLSQKALKISESASDYEKDYINALAVRYTDNPSADLIPLRYAYRTAMKKVMQKYPQDLDVACLYTESILDLNPWKYWTLDGKPEEGTMEAIDVLQEVLRKNPNHIGANHYYIHAVEASPYPEKALLSAYRLMTLAPTAGHLLHMPCHIFLLVGDYEEAIKTSKRAIHADKQYIQQFGIGGNYPLHYLRHNYKVLARAYMLAEEYNNAINTAHELNLFLLPHYEAMPALATAMLVPLEIFMYFQRWTDLLSHRLPKTDNPFILSYWHFSRALAYANLGKPEEADKEKKMMLESKKMIPADDEVSLNPSTKIIDIAEFVLNASFAKAKGDLPNRIDNLKNAAALQDTLNYDEPPAWYAPVVAQLGRCYLENNQYAEAEESFRKGLQHLQRNGRLLLGLAISLEKQNRVWDAYWVRREAQAALQQAQRPIILDDF